MKVKPYVVNTIIAFSIILISAILTAYIGSSPDMGIAWVGIFLLILIWSVILGVVLGLWCGKKIYKSENDITKAITIGATIILVSLFIHIKAGIEGAEMIREIFER